MPPQLVPEPFAPQPGQPFATGNTDASGRYHALDALRATALLLGVALHAALSYIPGDQVGWAVQDRSANDLFGVGVLVVHAFRLPVFFLLAGFFARLVVQRRGTGAFVRDRLVRILVPLVLGWLLVESFVAFAWIWGRFMHGDPALAGRALALGFGELLNQLGRLRHPVQFGGEFTLTHLWFLYVLLQIYVLFLAARFALVRTLDRDGQVAARLDRGASALAGSRWLLPVLAAATAVVLLAMRHWGIDTPDRSLLPHPAVLLLYGGVFTCGWWLQRNPALMTTIQARWTRHLVAGALLAIPVVLLIGLEPTAAGSAHGRLVTAVYALLYAALLWAWTLGLLGVFLRVCRNESRVWRYLADASYWVYIVHLPIVCSLQVWLSRYGFSCWAKFGLVLVVAVPVCLLSYHLVGRSTPVGLLLNGRRHPFRWKPY
jgi:peptidoglycan/LPS O-acetylase OafA/YrhL